ncbi:hypothetical protein HYN48_07355 [Flavobacterium magnum]|uniref:Uncharacterized protein n=1 Tax=Flavobacterium magnum TaxID=2162713 RepID=A0A2S0RF43_9FLAO|nr:hypothetical protein HYN48_07355 [Flavobacterium magnum]
MHPHQRHRTTDWLQRRLLPPPDSGNPCPEQQTASSTRHHL